MTENNEAVRKHRARRLSEGDRYVQVRLDPESIRVLEKLKRKMHLKRKTSEIVKTSLKLLLNKISEKP